MPKKRKTDPEWEQHQAELEWLYRRYSLNEVKAHMEKTYGFSKSDNQYRSRFKEWNIRKTANSDKWKFVYQRVKRRKLEEKRSDVYCNHTLVSEEKLKKEISRHVPPSFQYTCGEEPPTPEGISICTPAASGDLPDSEHEISSDISAHMPPNTGPSLSLLLNNLPCFQFQNLLFSHFPTQAFGGQDSSFIPNSFELVDWQPTLGLGPEEIVAPNAAILDDQFAATFDYTLLQNSATNLDGCYTPRTMNCNISAQASVDLVTEDSLRNARALLSDCLKEEGWDRAFPAGDNVDDIAATLEPIMVELSDGDLTQGAKKLFGSSKSDAVLHFLQFCIYLSSNNLMSEIQTRRLLHWLTTNGLRYMLKNMLRENSTTIEVFSSNLLRIAVKQEDVETTRILVDGGVETDAPSGLVAKRTALKEAVEVGNTHLVQMLLDAGANPDAAGDGEETPLCGASRLCRAADLVRMLLDAGANPNPPQAPAKRSPLQLAVERGDPDVVRLLLDSKANPNPSSLTRLTPLQSACMLGDTEVVEILVRAGADVDTTSDPDCEFDDEEIESHRFAVGSKFARSYRTPIQLAAQGGNWEAVQILLEEGAEIDLSLYTRSQTELELALWGNDILDWELLSVFSPLQATVREGNGTMVRLLLRSGAHVDARPQDDYGCTALQVAVLVRDKRLVQLLLQKGADVNAPAGPLFGRTALQAAAMQPHDTELLTLLIESGADVDVPPGREGGMTALQAAANAGNIEAVKLLIDSGANVNANACLGGGKTALQSAISSDSDEKVEIVKMLLKAKADVNAGAARYRGVTAIQAAVQDGNKEIVHLLLRTGASVDPQPGQADYAPLLQAVHGEDVEMTALLLSEGANPNIPPDECARQTPVQLAAQTDNISVVRLLLSWGADVNAAESCRQTALQAAAARGSVPVLKELLGAGADVNARHNGESALQCAVFYDKTEVVRLLLRHGATLDASNGGANSGILAMAVRHWCLDDDLVGMLIKAGASVNPAIAEPEARDVPLQTAASRGRFNLVQMLLTAGANVNIRSVASTSPVTALQAAIQSNNVDIVRALIARGADINAPANEKGGLTALQGALSIGNSEIVELLLQNGADVNSPPSPNGGKTALQVAASKGHVRLTERLLHCGARVNAPPSRNSGATALQVAAIAGNIRIVMMLLAAGADVNGTPALENGRTAIEGAAENGRLDTLHLLLNAHLNTEDLKWERMRAAKLAIRNGHFAIARFIKAYKKP